MVIAFIGLFLALIYGLFVGVIIANSYISGKTNETNNFGDEDVGLDINKNIDNFGVIESAINMNIGRDHYYSDMVYNQVINKRGHGK